jgi:hypothetical protein
MSASAPVVSKALPSPGWYIVSGGLLMIAAALAGIGFSQAASTVQDMQRAPMPGVVEVVLPPGPTTVYVEGDAPAITCTITGPAPVIQQPSEPRSYDSEGYRGRAALDLDVATGGTYALACRGADSFQIAIGQGAGAARVLMLAALLPALGGLVAWFVVWRKRRAA